MWEVEERWLLESVSSTQGIAQNHSQTFPLSSQACFLCWLRGLNLLHGGCLYLTQDTEEITTEVFSKIAFAFG